MSSDVRDTLNLTSSSNSLSEDNASFSAEEREEDDEDEEIKRMLAEEIINFNLVGSLPPTPRPLTRASSVSSLASISLPPTPKKNEVKRRAPVPCKNFKAPKSKKEIQRRKNERDICRDYGIDIGHPDFETLLDDKEDELEPDRRGDKDEGIFIKPISKAKPKPTVNNIVDELISMCSSSSVPTTSPISSPTKRKKPKKIKQIKPKPAKSKEDDPNRLDKRWTQLKITPDARCAVLKNDVETVRKTKDAIDALIMVLENTKMKLINDDKDLVYTEPPFQLKEKVKLNVGFNSK